MTLGSLIRARREELGLSQADVAHAVGIASPEFIGMVEKGVRRVALAKAAAFAGALELNHVDFCRWVLLETDCAFYSVLFGPDMPSQPRSQAE